MQEGTTMSTAPLRPHLRAVKKPAEHEDVPVGSLVQTPTGRIAKVEGYRGFRRGHRVWLVCRYLHPENKRFDVVQLLPELVVVLAKGGQG